MTSRRAIQTAALVALLGTLPEDQLQDVLAGLAVKGVVVREDVQQRARRHCGVCGHLYPRCRTLAQATGDDHDFTPTDGRTA